MADTPITELDFAGIKSQLKEYLRGQTRFKDYDFEGSNMSVLLDILAYNTYQNNFYTNMAFSEMFLDSALKKDSVLSHAKELNYLPRSSKSSVALVYLSIVDENSNASFIRIPEKTKFTTTYQNASYTFLTRTAYNALRVTGTSRFETPCMEIYQGVEVEEGFFLDNPSSGIVLSNTKIDTDSIRVYVEKSQNVYEEYVFTKDIFGVEESDKVFYLQPARGERYAVYFGQDIFGAQPTRDRKIKVTYTICDEDAPNGASRFACPSFPTSVVTIDTRAYGGAEAETAEEIKFFAPKSIQTQERAVTFSDYENLLKQNFPRIKSVSVYGGEEMSPPRYGKVAVSVNLNGNLFPSQNFKTQMLTYLSGKTPIGIQPVIIDPDYMYAQLSLNVYYDTKITNKSASEIEAITREAISVYNADSLSDFASTLEISRLSYNIDTSDKSIMSNTINTKPIIDYSPAIGSFQNPSFEFQTALIKPYAFDTNEDYADYTPAIKSSNYTLDGNSVFFQDDGEGNIQILSSDTQTIQVIKPSVGTVDYSTGKVSLVNFKADEYAGTSIKIYANSLNKNITSPKSRIFYIRDEDVSINVIGAK